MVLGKTDTDDIFLAYKFKSVFYRSDNFQKIKTAFCWCFIRERRKMSKIAISVKNLTKIYKLYDKPIDRLKETLSITKKKYHREHYALRDISFDVKEGESVGIIGTNGSGKSTILKIITGVLNQTSGELKVKGKISALLELGAGFNLEYTGMENIYLNGTMMGYTKEEIEKKLDNIINFYTEE